jgi:Fe-S-cluster containining protein
LGRIGRAFVSAPSVRDGSWQNAVMGDIIPADLQAAFERERAQAREDARTAREASAARAMTIRMYGRLAALQQTVIRDEQVGVACARGCAYCCHLRVEVRPHEAFVLAHHIQTRFDSARRERALARIEQNLGRIAGLSAQQHIRAGVPCALLEDGVCSVYEGRPAACRKYYSVSVDTCRNAFNDTAAPLTGPLEHDQLRVAGNAVALGFAKGLEDAGLNAETVELHRALKLALESNKSEKRYRAGKKPFV